MFGYNIRSNMEYHGVREHGHIKKTPVIVSKSPPTLESFRGLKRSRKVYNLNFPVISISNPHTSRVDGLKPKKKREMKEIKLVSTSYYVLCNLTLC